MLRLRRGREGAKIVSKEPCFINVNTVTGQNDQSPSSIHNYYSTQRKKAGYKEQGRRGRKVQTGAVRWTAQGKWGSIKFVISNTPPRSLQSMALATSAPSLLLSLSLSPSLPLSLSGLIVCAPPSHILILSLTLPSFLHLKAPLSIRSIKVEWFGTQPAPFPNPSPSPSLYLICMTQTIKVNGAPFSIYLPARYSHTIRNNLNRRGRGAHNSPYLIM